MRRTKNVTVLEEGRDKGKVFLVTEMDADRAEEWAIRALLLLTAGGATLPDGVHGMAGIAAAGYEALGRLKFDDVKPLLDQMFECVQYVHDPKQPPQALRTGVNAQIEDVATRLMLRKEVFALHTDFLQAGATQT